MKDGGGPVEGVWESRKEKKRNVKEHNCEFPTNVKKDSDSWEESKNVMTGG